jgi:hypothetical protein
VATKKGRTTTASRSTGRAVAFAQPVEDRRETPRLVVPGVEAEVETLGLRVTIREVGFGGLSIESAHEFQVGEIHQLRYGTSDEDAVVLHARVKHCRSGQARHKQSRYVTGFEFIDRWCPGDRSSVDEFISRVTIGLSADTPRR